VPNEGILWLTKTWHTKAKYRKLNGHEEKRSSKGITMWSSVRGSNLGTPNLGRGAKFRDLMVNKNMAHQSKITKIKWKL
jgi:hypothetical protein